jgi:hypothetical protein
MHLQFGALDAFLRGLHLFEKMGCAGAIALCRQFNSKVGTTFATGISCFFGQFLKIAEPHRHHGIDVEKGISNS